MGSPPRSLAKNIEGGRKVNSAACVMTNMPQVMDLEFPCRSKDGVFLAVI